MTHSRATLLLAFVVNAIALPAAATTFVPMPIEDLTRGSVAVVVGQVQATGAVTAANGRIYTLVDLSIDEVLSGQVPSAITLREPGGAVGEIAEIYDGVPAYNPGDQVAVFLAVWPDGSLRTNHLSLGRWGIDQGAGGQLRARQAFGRGVTVIPPPGGALPATEVSLADLRAAVERGRAAPSMVPPGPAPVAIPPEGRAGAAASSGGVAPYTLMGGNPRFFEPDEGTTVNFLIDDRGDSTLGLVASRQAVVDAMAEWTGVGTATITMANPAGAAGLTTDLNLGCASIAAVDPHRIVWDDPNNDIPSPNMCGGVLALGGGCYQPLEAKVFGSPSTTFSRRIKGTVEFANGWNACPSWTQCNVAEVAMHEIGHVIGLGHSADADATMTASAHFDARCADVRTDDIDGVTFIYPTTSIPSVTTANPLTPLGQIGMAYSKTLAASGGTMPYTWSADTTNGWCDDCGLTLDSAGMLSGTMACTSCRLYAKVTDNAGLSHQKAFDLDAPIPFGGDDTGCVPVTKSRLKCGDTIAKAAAKLVKAVDKCHCNQAKARFAGDPAANANEELCEDSNLGKAAKEKYDKVKAKLVSLGICTATQVANMDTLRDTLLANLDGARNAAIYCDGSTPIGGDDSGNVPSTADALSCECSAGKNAAKLFAAALKCHIKNADSLYKFKMPPFDEEACEETSPSGKGAHDKYTAAAAKLIAKGICPACLDSAAEHDALATSALSIADTENDKPYPCE